LTARRCSKGYPPTPRKRGSFDGSTVLKGLPPNPPQARGWVDGSTVLKGLPPNPPQAGG